MSEEEFDLILIVAIVAVMSIAGAVSVVVMIWALGSAYPPPLVLLA